MNNAEYLWKFFKNDEIKTGQFFIFEQRASFWLKNWNKEQVEQLYNLFLVNFVKFETESKAKEIPIDQCLFPYPDIKHKTKGTHFFFELANLVMHMSPAKKHTTIAMSPTDMEPNYATIPSLAAQIFWRSVALHLTSKPGAFADKGINPLHLADRLSDLFKVSEFLQPLFDRSNGIVFISNRGEHDLFDNSIKEFDQAQPSDRVWGWSDEAYNYVVFASVYVAGSLSQYAEQFEDQLESDLSRMFPDKRAKYSMLDVIVPSQRGQDHPLESIAANCRYYLNEYMTHKNIEMPYQMRAWYWLSPSSKLKHAVGVNPSYSVRSLMDLGYTGIAVMDRDMEITADRAAKYAAAKLAYTSSVDDTLADITPVSSNDLDFDDDIGDLPTKTKQSFISNKYKSSSDICFE